MDFDKEVQPAILALEPKRQHMPAEAWPKVSGGGGLCANLSCPF
jgi:hypothetical protein